MESKTVTLQPNVEKTLDLKGTVFDDFAITNVSFSDVWVSIDKPATIDGDGCIIVKANSFRTLGALGKVVHLISKSNAKVEVQGLVM